MKISQELKDNYLQNPNQCPVCGGRDISSGDMETDDTSAWARVDCENCGSTWQDVYDLSDIDNLEPNAAWLEANNNKLFYDTKADD